MGLSFTPITLTDVDEVASKFAALTGRGVASCTARLRHLVARHPLGFWGLVVRDSHGSVVAHYGATPVPVVALGKPGVVGRLAMCWVDPRYRTGGWHGLSIELDQAFRDSYENESHTRTILATFAETDFWQMRRLGDHEALRTSVELVREPKAATSGEGEGDIQDLDASFCRTWSEPFLTSETCTRRDGELMSFRLSGPFESDHGIAVLRQGSVKACAIYRDSSSERLILDLAADSQDEACADRLIRVLIGDGNQRIVIPRFGRSSLLLRLQRAGFRVGAHDEIMLSVRSSWPRVNGASLADSWELTAADSGRFGLPQLLPKDTACGPPPPGTRAGSDRHT